ncbi:putative target of rapamycin (TOR) kinase 1 [Trypanosoma cruzi]|uniref:Putative target of rapamycin (TOR) kinase 1 n=1 Tax=Trypanosoma cruzi TaxID=5693 RepID=A0A2V2XAB7_TRYCR|nr:putative target of rapamycin (TOR) kinase 1 [Trypanosoma cruzi]
MEEEVFLLSCRPRHFLCAACFWLLSHFSVHYRHFGDNTLLQGAANKGSSKSHALTWEPQRKHEFLESCGIQASFSHVVSAENPTDGISRGRVFTLQDLAKGSGGVLWQEESKVCHFVSYNISITNKIQRVMRVAIRIYILGADNEEVASPRPLHLTFLFIRLV